MTSETDHGSVDLDEMTQDELLGDTVELSAVEIDRVRMVPCSNFLLITHSASFNGHTNIQKYKYHLCCNRSSRWGRQNP